MGLRWELARACLLVTVTGCGAESEPLSPSNQCRPPNRVVADRCLEPGVQDDGCPAGTLGLEDGSCQPAGVPPELCGAGFVPDGDMGCEPILPPEPCPKGQMAVPGESACHAVMPCGTGKWGDIPVDATTVYVDARYPGLDGDGSSEKPFTTISDAVAAAPSGGLIAVAAGSYLEDVVVQYKAVRLWGKCPGEVELLGASFAALLVREGASGTEVHGLALGGASVGLFIAGAESVHIDSVWVHDALDRGINVQELGPTSVMVRGSLVEENHELGMLVMGSDATLEGLVMRGTLPRTSDQLVGWGISIQLVCTEAGCDPEARSSALVRGSLVEENHDVGVRVEGSDATFEGLVVRRTLPRASDRIGGRGINIERSCYGEVCDPAARSRVLVRGSLVEENHEIGVLVGGSDATLEGLVVRRTLPRASDQFRGWGINIQLACSDIGCDPAARSSALLRGSLVEENHDVGVIVGASDATLEGLLVRRTLPGASDQRFGRGIHIQPSCTLAGCDPTTRATALVRGSLVEENHDLGVGVSGSDVTLEGVLARGTLVRQADGIFGDGFNISISSGAPSNATVTQSRIETSARAGLANFASFVTLGASALACNRFDLEGETYREQAFTFEDHGDNACGCPAPAPACKAQSVGLEPPEPLTQ